MSRGVSDVWTEVRKDGMKMLDKLISYVLGGP